MGWAGVTGSHAGSHAWYPRVCHDTVIPRLCRWRRKGGGTGCPGLPSWGKIDPWDVKLASAPLQSEHVGRVLAEHPWTTLVPHPGCRVRRGAPGSWPYLEPEADGGHGVEDSHPGGGAGGREAPTGQSQGCSATGSLLCDLPPAVTVSPHSGQCFCMKRGFPGTRVFHQDRTSQNWGLARTKVSVKK